jgi:hypothetical protein
MIRVVLPFHLRRLAGSEGEVRLAVEGPLTIAGLLDALEALHPVLRGTIRETGTLRRRAYVRYFACKRDLSHEPHDAPLPEAVARGEEAFRIVGAMSGG